MSAYAEEPALTDSETVSDVPDRLFPDAAYAAGIGAIKAFVPGGMAVGSVIESIVKSVDGGPILSDLSYEISEMRNEMAENFADVKN
ncbi:MAG: hypothetical protein IJS03_04475 [Eubacterium sp.]|nr:hypothetical protein [Eubacterium sp.]